MLPKRSWCHQITSIRVEKPLNLTRIGPGVLGLIWLVYVIYRALLLTKISPFAVSRNVPFQRVGDFTFKDALRLQRKEEKKKHYQRAENDETVKCWRLCSLRASHAWHRIQNELPTGGYRELILFIHLPHFRCEDSNVGCATTHLGEASLPIRRSNQKLFCAVELMGLHLNDNCQCYTGYIFRVCLRVSQYLVMCHTLECVISPKGMSYISKIKEKMLPVRSFTVAEFSYT